MGGEGRCLRARQSRPMGRSTTGLGVGTRIVPSIAAHQSDQLPDWLYLSSVGIGYAHPAEAVAARLAERCWRPLFTSPLRKRARSRPLLLPFGRAWPLLRRIHSHAPTHCRRRWRFSWRRMQARCLRVPQAGTWLGFSVAPTGRPDRRACDCARSLRTARARARDDTSVPRIATDGSYYASQRATTPDMQDVCGT